MGGGMRAASSPGSNQENMTLPGGAQSRTPSTPPGHLQNHSPGNITAQHQMSLAMNGGNPQLPHQPKKRGRKKKSEMILTPEE